MNFWYTDYDWTKCFHLYCYYRNILAVVPSSHLWLLRLTDTTGEGWREQWKNNVNNINKDGDISLTNTWKTGFRSRIQPMVLFFIFTIETVVWDYKFQILFFYIFTSYEHTFVLASPLRGINLIKWVYIANWISLLRLL